MNRTWVALAMVVATGATSAVADQKYDDPDAIIAELRQASVECSEIADGQVKDEIFGIKMIRVGDTCVIINGDEIDHRALNFLEERKLPWAGVGLWIKANPDMD